MSRAIYDKAIFHREQQMDRKVYDRARNVLPVEPEPGPTPPPPVETHYQISGVSITSAGSGYMENEQLNVPTPDGKTITTGVLSVEQITQPDYYYIDNISISDGGADYAAGDRITIFAGADEDPSYEDAVYEIISVDEETGAVLAVEALTTGKFPEDISGEVEFEATGEGGGLVLSADFRPNIPEDGVASVIIENAGEFTEDLSGTYNIPGEASTETASFSITMEAISE